MSVYREREEEGWGDKNRMLFNPSSVSIHMLSQAPVITSKFQGKKFDHAIQRNNSRREEFIDEIYHENKH